MSSEPLDLDAIEARANAATVGPWSSGESEDSGTSIVYRHVRWETVARDADDDDAAFIAHARTDVPALVHAVKERDAEILRLQALVEAAFKEGNGAPSPMSDEAEEREWQRSQARKALGTTSTLADTARVDALLDEIDAIARESMDYGLPDRCTPPDDIWDRMRETVRAWLRGE